MSFFVGLTGGIGSGKSTVANLFAELNIPIIDTDQISHQLTQTNGAAIPAIKAEFGESFIDTDNSLDRAKMRQLVFSDATARLKLENILHPLILKQARSLAVSIQAPYVLVVVPLLFETANYLEWLHHTVTVDCAETTQISRASKRTGMNESAVRAIMSQQMPRSERQKLAADTILNEGTLDDLRMQIAQLNNRYLELAKRSN